MLLRKLSAGSALSTFFDGVTLTRNAYIHSHHDETDDTDAYYV
jgi:hypothetical protein